MPDLIKLSASKGDIRVLEKSAVEYRQIGIILLNDNSGAIVSSITKAAYGQPETAIEMVYQRWICQHEDHSWKKLIQCFRDVQLNSLAKDIEQHFGLFSPSGAHSK